VMPRNGSHRRTSGGYSASDADLAGKQALFIPDAATSGTIPGN
jgi:hypothetical protein